MRGTLSITARGNSSRRSCAIKRQGGIVRIVTNARSTFGRALATAALCGAILLPAPAIAQDNPITFNFGAGPFWPNGEVGDRFDTGFTIPVGITAN
jgi:hypothetical protein